MGLFLPSCVVFVAGRAPPGRESTAQALLVAVIFGVAPLIASQLAGVAFDAAGPRWVLAIAAVLMLVSLGQVGGSSELAINRGICLEKSPDCDSCGLDRYCEFHRKEAQ